MRIKRKNGLKMIVIALVLLLCLALAVGITGAYYQAKRQATGTLSMDQGIIIDYNGFDKTGDEWSKWERTATLPLFSITDAQPGQNIPVNAAGIRANEKSVNFYARVKLTYKFYNGETPVELADATKLIKTSSSFWANSWVDGGSSDGYYYYATGTTLNKFEKGAAATTPFVNLFADGAQFEIAGAGFTGADNDGESGGFKIDDTTSINKIEVYLTLETLQGDADAAAEGWKIASQVKFSEATGKMETSVGKTETTEDLNVSVNNGEEVAINDVVFNYDSDTTLKFDSNNVEYISLIYSDGSTETFDAETYEVAENTFKVNAKSSKGTVTGYTVGLWSDSEYTGFTYSKKYTTSGSLFDEDEETGDSDNIEEILIGNEVSLSGYFGDSELVKVADTVKVKNRDFKISFIHEGKNFLEKLGSSLSSIQYPCKMYGKTYSSMEELENGIIAATDGWVWHDTSNEYTQEEIEAILKVFPSPAVISFETLCESMSLFADEAKITRISGATFLGNNNITKVELGKNILKIGSQAFFGCSKLNSIEILGNVKYLGINVFEDCSSLTTINLPDSISWIGECLFRNCTSLETIKLPASLTEIIWMFDGCVNLKSVIIGDNISVIEYGSFSGCSNLESIVLPSSVTAIRIDAFSGCSKLATKISDIGGTWVKESDNMAVSADTLLRNINYAIKRTA